MILGKEEFHNVININCAVFERDGQLLANFMNKEGMEDIIQNAIDNYTLRLIEEEVIA